MFVSYYQFQFCITIADLKFLGVSTYVAGMVIGADIKSGVLSEAKYKPILKVFDAVMGNEKIRAFNEEFNKNMATFRKDSKNNIYKYAGKSVYASTLKSVFKEYPSQNTNKSSFKVTYYAFTGRAEPLRLAAALGGVAFEDEFITQAQQGKAKKEGKRRWSGPPEIVIYDKDGKEVTTIGQSNACLRYIGNISGVYPTNPAARALVDEILDSTEDLFGAVLPAAFRAKDEADKKAKCAEVCKEGGPLRYWLDKFLLRLAENEKRGNKNGLFVGDSITIADLKFMGVATYIASGMVIGADSKSGVLSEEKYKPILKVFDAVNRNDKIKAFQAELNKNIAAFRKDQKNNSFKYAGKSVYGSINVAPEEEAKYAEPQELPEMEYRMLGKTGLKVSVLGLGTMSFVNEQQAMELMSAVRAYGVNFFDNAELYGEPCGNAEILFGSALKKLQAKDPKLWRRSDLVITTKLFFGPGDGKQPNSPIRPYAQNEAGLSRKHLMEGINGSLERLGLEYVDVLYAHRYDPLTPMEEIVRGFTNIIRSGKALYWGTSCWTSQKVTEAYWIAKMNKLIPPVVEQPRYNMFSRQYVEIDYKPLYAEPYRIGTTVWSPLDAGVLTGKYVKEIPKGSRLAGNSHLGNWWTGKYLQEEKNQRVAKLMEIAKEMGVSMVSLALGWVIKNKNVSVCMLGGSKAYQLTQNAEALIAAKKLNVELMAKIEEILGNKPSIDPMYRSLGGGRDSVKYKTDPL